MSAQQAEVVPAERSLSVQLAERSITNPQWHTLSKSLYPGASQASVLMVIDYCRARNLDPLKKPCHIVPMQVKVGRDYEWRDVVLPGIYELRTTAMRTGLYLGHSKPEYGPEIEFMGVKAPEYVDLVIYRWNDVAKLKAEFPVRVRFAEVCGTTWDKEAKAPKVNARWSKAPVQMMVKCGEAAGLREAFPDELGGQMTVEEMEGQRQLIDVTPDKPTLQINPETGKPEFVNADGSEYVPPKKLGPKKLRETIEGIVKATENKDGPALLKIRKQFDNDQWQWIWGELHSWHKTEARPLLELAEKADGGIGLDAWSCELLRKCTNAEEHGAAWRAIQDAYADNDSEVPESVVAVADEMRSSVGA